MALNLKDPEAERLATEIAALTGETKTGAIRVALRERRDKLTESVAARRREGRIRRFLVDEAWPQVPEAVRGTELSRDERERLLGYGPDGV